jgi:membrane fusion protein (multidrug efflux system)
MWLRRFLILGLVGASLFVWGCGTQGPAKVENPPEAGDSREAGSPPEERSSPEVGSPPAAQATVLPEREERKVECVEVSPQPLTYTLSAVGSLNTPENVTISSKKAGIIQKIFAKEGDRVSKGQTLVQLDDVNARLEVERSEAKLREAEAYLETNRTTLLRYQKLLDSKVISQQGYDDANLKVKLDEARVALAKAELTLARQSLSDHRIVSPIEGLVSLKIASLGEHVNVAPKDEILKIVQMSPLELEFDIPENWAGKVQGGSRIQFTVKAYSQEKFTGVVQFISPTADPATRNVKMKAVVQNADYRLKPGFFAEVTIQTGNNPNALVVPESALFSQEGRFFAFITEDGVARRKEVETGLRFDGKVEIVKGIQKGAWVVTAGHEQLSEGTPVKISKR